MTTDEFEAALNDLETRVDRLRALYENWFRGYEKTEPAVARKEVERRVYALRKELPRNTALRFRYHQLYLRFTSLATYWQRTARAIEDGTHKLQLQRMRRRNQRVEQREGANEEKDKPERPQHYELDLDESLNVDNLLDDLEIDEVAKAIEAPGPHSEPPPPALEPPKRPPPAVRSFARHRREESLPSLPPVALDDADFPPTQASFAARKQAGPPAGASDFPEAPTSLRQQPAPTRRADKRELPFPAAEPRARPSPRERSLPPPSGAFPDALDHAPARAQGATRGAGGGPEIGPAAQGGAPKPAASAPAVPPARAALGEPQRTLAGVGQPQPAPARAAPGGAQSPGAKHAAGAAVPGAAPQPAAAKHAAGAAVSGTAPQPAARHAAGAVLPGTVPQQPTRPAAPAATSPYAPKPAAPAAAAGTSPYAPKPAAPAAAAGTSPYAPKPAAPAAAAGTSPYAPKPAAPAAGTSPYAPKPAAPAAGTSPYAPKPTAPAAAAGTSPYAPKPAAPAVGAGTSPQASRPAAPGAAVGTSPHAPGAAAPAGTSPHDRRPATAAAGTSPQASSQRAGNAAPAGHKVPIASGTTIVGRPPLSSPLSPAEPAAPSEQRLKRIYDEYTAARRRNNEGEIRYEAMVNSIQKMLPELTKKHQGKPIDFEVVVKDGRVGLKPKAT